jgi:hypothetical protein
MTPFLFFLAGFLLACVLAAVAFAVIAWWIARSEKLAEVIGPVGRERLP